MSVTNGSVPAKGDMPMESLNTDKPANMSLTESENVMLVERSHHLDTKTAMKLRHYALVVSWLSVVILTIMGLIAFVLAIHYKNSSAFAFALDAFLDSISSAIVIWRFWGTASAIYSGKRESRACIILGVLFIVSFVSILSRSSVALAMHIRSEKAMVVWVAALINAVLCLVFLVTKAILARRLESISLATDAVNSALGFILAFSSVVDEIVYDEDSALWYMDPVVGLVCSVFMLGYGIWLIVYEMKYAKHSSEEIPEKSND